MRRLVLLLVIMAYPLIAAPLLISDVTVISPERAEPLAAAYVLIENDRILSVSTQKPDIKGAVRIDGKGKFLIPGLIDSHVHLGAIPGMNFPHTKKYPKMYEAYKKQLPRSYLYYGYTGVVDLNVVERDFINGQKAQPVTPDIFDCGAALVLANGYPMSFIPGPERFEIFKGFVYDESQKDKIPASFNPAEHTPAALVEAAKKDGAVCIKSHYEPGFGKEKLPIPSRELFNEIATASQKAGLPLFIHANSYVAQKFAVDSDIRVFAHGMWNWGEFSKAQDLPQPIAEVLDKVIAKNLGYQPTFQVIAGLRSFTDPKYLQDPALRNVYPADMLRWFGTKEGQWFKHVLLEEADMPETQIRKEHDRILSQLTRVVKYLDGKNARFLMGSDTPSAPIYTNPPGLNGFQEMQFWVKAGISLPRIFNAATLENAKAFGLQEKYGTVEAKKVANLLLLKKNPLESVEAYDSIDTVFVHGHPYARHSLKAR